MFCCFKQKLLVTTTTTKFFENAIDKFGKKPRRLQLLFKN